MNVHLQMKVLKDYRLCLAKLWEGSAAICVIVTNKAVKALSPYNILLSLSLSQSLSQYTIYMQYLPSTLTCFTLLCPFLLSKLFSPGINLFPLALVLVFTIHQFNLCLIKMTSEEKTQKFFDVSALTSSNIQILSSHTNGLFYVLPFPPTPFPESTDFIGLLL